MNDSVPQHPLLKFFEYNHLPPNLQAVSKHFYTLAVHVNDTLPAGAEATVCVRKLLEAKDCAVRSALS